MAARCVVTNRAKYMLAHQSPALDFDSTTIKIGLVKAALSGQTDTQLAAVNFVSDLVAISAEVTVSGYARKASGGADFTLSATEEDANNRSVVTISADIVWTLATGETVYGAFLMAERGGADTANEVIQIIEFASGIPTNGGTFTLQFPTDTGTTKVVTKLS